ncbi:unnamed protein product [Arabidopsis halleri]
MKLFWIRLIDIHEMNRNSEQYVLVAVQVGVDGGGKLSAAKEEEEGFPNGCCVCGSGEHLSLCLFLT